MRGFLISDGVCFNDLAECLEKLRNLTRSGWSRWVCLLDRAARSRMKTLSLMETSETEHAEGRLTL